MDCREALKLIPHSLEESVAGEQKAALAAHLAKCESCAGEMVLQKRLSVAMRGIGLEEVQAPPELCGLVMGRLQTERRTAFRWIPEAWRKFVAAAAALLLIAGSSAGITTALKMADSGKMVGYETSAPEVELSAGVDHSRLDTGGNSVSPQGDPDPVQPAGNTDPTGGINPGPSSAAGRDNTGTASIETDSDKVSAASGDEPTATAEPQVFLNSRMKVNSTLLKVMVDGVNAAKTKATAIATNAGAMTQSFPAQSGAKEVLVMRLTVKSEQAAGLLAQLVGLGTPVDKQDESRDITSLYNGRRTMRNAGSWKRRPRRTSSSWTAGRRRPAST